MLIKGCIGFAHHKGRFIGTMMCVKGKTVRNVYLPYPIYYIMKRLWSSKNILRKFLWKKDITFASLEKYKRSR